MIRVVALLSLLFVFQVQAAPFLESAPFPLDGATPTGCQLVEINAPASVTNLFSMGQEMTYDPDGRPYCKFDIASLPARNITLQGYTIFGTSKSSTTTLWIRKIVAANGSVWYFLSGGLRYP